MDPKDDPFNIVIKCDYDNTSPDCRFTAGIMYPVANLVNEADGTSSITLCRQFFDLKAARTCDDPSQQANWGMADQGG